VRNSKGLGKEKMREEAEVYEREGERKSRGLG
jgi:hypothetical protein